MRHIIQKNILIILSTTMLCACSDFFRTDFTHIPSVHNAPKEIQTTKELEIQAMRKSQILENNRTRVLMIVRYMNEIDKKFLKQDEGEVFLVEIYTKDTSIPLKSLTFHLSNGYKSIESVQILKMQKADLGHFIPDITYNDIYKVVFHSIGLRGRDNLKFSAQIQNIGSMDFDFGYAKRESKLAQ
ncbi:hypothetical protein [uncultured Helicobacter sp.]|uniref:hypothetical protein n=1 Tax=uncultured Helicobacter sp. TaxID=175537 RepID=UPI002616FC36|nr:hypothetical protein [uncultured Helicobacter sp.]